MSCGVREGASDRQCISYKGGWEHYRCRSEVGEFILHPLHISCPTGLPGNPDPVTCVKSWLPCAAMTRGENSVGVENYIPEGWCVGGAKQKPHICPLRPKAQWSVLLCILSGPFGERPNLSASDSHSRVPRSFIRMAL